MPLSDTGAVPRFHRRSVFADRDEFPRLVERDSLFVEGGEVAALHEGKITLEQARKLVSILED